MRPEEVMPPSAVLDDEPFDDDDLAEWAAFDWTQIAADDALVDAARSNKRVERVAGWAVTNDDEAEWAARKLAAAAAAVREVDLRADDYISRINAWRYESTRLDQRTIEVMTSKLHDYALVERVEHDRATIKVPSAEFGTTASSPKATVVDDDTVASYIETRVTASDDAAVKWFEAGESTGDGGMSAWLGAVMNRSTKVYITPLRKLVKIAQRADGYDEVVTLRCEHTQSYRVDSLDRPDALTVGEIAECDVCGDEQPIMHVEYVPRFEHIVVGPDDQPVPGTAVDPGGISTKEVKLR